MKYPISKNQILLLVQSKPLNRGTPLVAKHFHCLLKRNIKNLKKQSKGFQRLVKREIERVNLCFGLYIGTIFDKAGISQKLFRCYLCSGIMTLEQIQITMDKVIFKNFIDQINIGHNRVGIFTTQLYMLYIRTTLQQHLDRVSFIIGDSAQIKKL